jgi:hypothetical protein
MQSFRVELVHSLLQESLKRTEEQMVILRRMEEKLDSQNKTSDMILTRVNGGVQHL